MAKDTFYFSHDYNTRTDIKIKKLIQKHGYVGYGIFWAIVEDLYNNANALPADYESIAYDLREDDKLIISVINDFDLFIIDNEIISSESVERRLILRDAKTDAARAAALARWEKEREKKRLKDANALNNDANALQNECDSNAIKESKEKEIKLNEIKPILNASCNYEYFIEEIKKSDKNKEESMRQYKLSEIQYNNALDEFIFQNKNDDPLFIISYTDEVKHFKRWLAKNIETIKKQSTQKQNNISLSEETKKKLSAIYIASGAAKLLEKYITTRNIDEVQGINDFERAKKQNVDYMNLQLRVNGNEKIYNY